MGLLGSLEGIKTRLAEWLVKDEAVANHLLQPTPLRQLKSIKSVVSFVAIPYTIRQMPVEDVG